MIPVLEGRRGPWSEGNVFIGGLKVRVHLHFSWQMQEVRKKNMSEGMTLGFSISILGTKSTVVQNGWNLGIRGCVEWNLRREGKFGSNLKQCMGCIRG